MPLLLVIHYFLLFLFFQLTKNSSFFFSKKKKNKGFILFCTPNIHPTWTTYSTFKFLEQNSFWSRTFFYNLIPHKGTSSRIILRCPPPPSHQPLFTVYMLIHNNGMAACECVENPCDPNSFQRHNCQLGTVLMMELLLYHVFECGNPMQTLACDLGSMHLWDYYLFLHSNFASIYCFPFREPKKKRKFFSNLELLLEWFWWTSYCLE